jgi:MYXO-CTERM domain-containing protein
VSVADLGLSATGQFTHRGCSTSGGGGGGGGGAFGPWWLITGVALLALRRRLRAT